MTRGLEEDAAETGRHGERAHGPAVGGEVFVFIECAEDAEPPDRFLERARLGTLEPVELAHPRHATGTENEDRLGEIHALNLGGRGDGSLLVFALAPESNRGAGAGPSGTSRPMIGGGAGYLLDVQGRDAAAMIERGTSLESRVDDEAHPVYRDGGLGDVSGNDDFRSAAARDGGILPVGGEFPVELVKLEAAAPRGISDRGDGLLDFIPARHKNEDMSLNAMLFEVITDYSRDVIPELARLPLALRFVADDDGKGAPVRNEMPAAFAEILLQREGLEGRGHDHDLEIRSPLALHVEAAGEADVTEEMAFVELVEDDGGDIGEVGLLDEFADENTLGHETNPGAGRDLVLKAHLIPDLVAETAIAFLRDAVGEHAGGEAAGLQHVDLAITADAAVGEELRDLRRFPRTGRSLDNNARPFFPESAEKLGLEFENGKGTVSGHAGAGPTIPVFAPPCK